MTIYENLSITDGDQLYEMLDDDTVFRDCDFDEADFEGIEADVLALSRTARSGAPISPTSSAMI